MALLDRHAHPRDFISRPGTLGHNDLKVPGLEHPRASLVIPIRKSILVERQGDVLARVRVKDDLLEALEFFLRAAEGADGVVDVNLDDIGASAGARVRDCEGKSDLDVFSRGALGDVNLGIGPFCGTVSDCMFEET